MGSIVKERGADDDGFFERRNRQSFKLKHVGDSFYSDEVAVKMIAVGKELDDRIEFIIVKESNSL